MNRADHAARSPLRVLFGILLLLAASFYVLIIVDSWREARRKEEVALANDSQLLAQAVGATMTSHAAMLQSVGEGLRLLGALEEPERGRELIERTGRSDPGMVAFGLARPDGQLLLISGVSPGRPLPNLMATPESRASFEAVLRGRTLQAGRPYFMKPLEQWVIPIRQPLFDRGGGLVAVLAAGYRIEGGTTAWARMSLGTDVGVLLVRGDGYRQYQHPLPAEKSERLLQRVYGQPVDAALQQRLRQLRGDAGIAELDIDGTAMLVSWRRLDEHGLLGMTIKPLDKVRGESLRSLLAPTLWLFGYLVAGYLIYRYARRLQAAAERQVRRVTALRQAILDGANYAIIATDLGGTVTSINAAAERMLGYTAAEVVGRATPALWHDADEIRRRAEELSAGGSDLPAAFDVFVAGARHGRPEEREWTCIRKDGSRLPMLLSVSVVRGADGEIAGYVGIASDISERKAAQDQLRHQAHHDALTGLANRSLLHLEFARRTAARGEAPAALMLMDLDHFKEINDTLGHHVGDTVLQQVAARLTEEMGSRGLVCRLGGDEFALIHESGGDVPPQAMAERMLAALRQPFMVGRLNLEIGASIGIALYPKDGKDSHDLLRSADVAMYQAKAEHAGIAFYSAERDTNTPERLALMTDLHQALSNDELLLHFQPKLDLASGLIVGFEALVRWQHPRRGLLHPDSFIPLAEMGELIHPMTLRVIELALIERRRWESAGRHHSVAVNISARNLLDASFVDSVGTLMKRYAARSGELEFELTETALIHDPEAAVRILDEIAGLGVRLSIDDFGTGYSSLSYLRRLPLDALKIDRSFVQSLTENEQDQIIVRSTIGLAQNLGLKVIAEGVEDAGALQRLAELGCDQAQGYFISRPLPAEQLADLPPRFDA